MLSFEQLFKSGDSPRDKFLSRLFGVFNEDPVRIWCRQPDCPFDDLGRPTLTPRAGGRGYTLDFCLRRKSDGLVFVAESKCELEYENYRYLTLVEAGQLLHHKGEAFRLFLEAARTPAAFIVTVKGKAVDVSGAILVWGRVTDAGRQAVIGATGVADVLSLEEIISSLIATGSDEYAGFVADRSRWCRELFDSLGFRVITDRG